MILLDTCALFWLEHDPDRISERAKQAISDPGVRCFASSISALELGLKVARGHVKLPLAPGAWLREVCLRRQIVELPVNFDVAGASALLPPIHKDPFDRILIATAIERALTMVTPDTFIRQYPDLQILW